jgi:hypothetical protein
MKLSELKTILKSISKVEFIFQNGKGIPKHFHVTEVGQISKNFIDCGGTKRNDTVINFQLWTAHDFDHLLSAQKLKTIIELSEKELSLKDYEIEVEYQSETIGKYGLDFNGEKFVLIATETDCLAKDSCIIPTEQANNDQCAPGSGCC